MKRVVREWVSHLKVQFNHLCLRILSLGLRYLAEWYVFSKDLNSRSYPTLLREFYPRKLLLFLQTTLQIWNKITIQHFVCGFSSFNLVKDHDISILKSSTITQEVESQAEICSGAHFRNPGLLESQREYWKGLPYYRSP